MSEQPKTCKTCKHDDLWAWEDPCANCSNNLENRARLPFCHLNWEAKEGVT